MGCLCAVGFPQRHEVGAVMARGNINNHFPCTLYASVGQERHALVNTVFVRLVLEANMCPKYKRPFKALVLHVGLL